MREKSVNPDIAVALKYDGKNAPKVTASGENDLARRILQIAEENNIPLHGDAGLAQVLSTIPPGDEIPRSLYVAVAEVIAFAFLVAGRIPPGFASDTEGE